MFLNLASNIPFIYNNWVFTFFEKKSFEKELPVFLDSNIIEELYIINWPWNFSTTRIWIEVLNIFLLLGKISKIYFLNKLEFFNLLWFYNIYLFSWNKNKFINLIENQEYKFVQKNNINKKLNVEEFFFNEIIFDNNFIKYSKILKNYKNIKWNQEKNILKPYYIFDPIVNF